MGKTFFYNYKLTIDVKADTGFQREQHIGVVNASSYGDAAKKLENYFGPELTLIEALEQTTNDSCVFDLSGGCEI